jgi:hypothetical protein
MRASLPGIGLAVAVVLAVPASAQVSSPNTAPNRGPRGPDGLATALLTDPWGTSLELSEGLNGWN